MKVSIGPYRSCVTFHSFFECLEHLGVSEERADRWNDWCWKHWLVGSLRKSIRDVTGKLARRREKVKIHGYDTWSADHTLALIIYPLLQRFQEHIGGYAIVDDEDISTRLSDEKRWYLVVEKMKRAFELILKEEDVIALTDEEHSEIKEGLRLFGKYYRALWN